MKKLTQTVLLSFHFLSMVVIAGIVYQVFGTSGIVNNVLSSFHIRPVNFVGDSSKWRAIYSGTGIWMGAGYGMIVYLAAMGDKMRALRCGLWTGPDGGNVSGM